jgi:hypothetical protein
MVPHGDRRDRPQSGGIEHQERGLGTADDHVVRVLVLHDHVDHLPRRRLQEPEPQEILKRPQPRRRVRPPDNLRRDPGARDPQLTHLRNMPHPPRFAPPLTAVVRQLVAAGQWPTWGFMKNVSLIGACLMIMHFGSGPYSLDS